jgi:predicted nucleic acid-binding Zn ribbon protein
VQDTAITTEHPSRVAARRCRVCGKAIPLHGRAFCDALCAATWRQLREQAVTVDRRQAMPADVLHTLHALLAGLPVERGASLRFYTWLRQPHA